MVPLLARIYPNGLADVNHFHAAGGMGFLIGELLDAGLLHDDIRTVWGDGLARLSREALLDGGRRGRWRAGGAATSHDPPCCARRASRSSPTAG